MIKCRYIKKFDGKSFMGKNFLKYLFFLIVMFSLNGCSSKIYSELINEDKLYEKSLLYTKKGEIVSSLETKAVVVATYLNPLDQEYDDKDKDYFIVALYAEKDLCKSKAGLESDDCDIRLKDGTKPSKVEKLKKESSLLRYIPVHNGWFKYYLVEFPSKGESKKVSLVFESRRFGKTELVFSK